MISEGELLPVFDCGRYPYRRQPSWQGMAKALLHKDYHVYPSAHSMISFSGVSSWRRSVARRAYPAPDTRWLHDGSRPTSYEVTHAAAQLVPVYSCHESQAGSLSTLDLPICCRAVVNTKICSATVQFTNDQDDAQQQRRCQACSSCTGRP